MEAAAVFGEALSDRSVRIHQCANAHGRRKKLTQQAQPLCRQLADEIAHASCVTARATETPKSRERYGLGDSLAGADPGFQPRSETRAALVAAVAPVAYCVRDLTEMDAVIRLMTLLLSAGIAATRFGA